MMKVNLLIVIIASSLLLTSSLRNSFLERLSFASKLLQRPQSSEYSTETSNKDFSQQQLKQFLKVTLSATLLASSPLTSAAAHAGWFGPSEVEKQINDLCTCQKQVTILHQQLQPSVLRNSIGVEIPMQMLKGGKEDSALLQISLENKLQPCQRTMERLTPQLVDLDEESRKKITNLPLLMKGHLLELQQAINSLKVTDQEKEVAEVEETLNDYLTIVSSKYSVNFYQGAQKQYLSDKEYYGPLGCEFWGKVRIDGSKNCLTQEEAAAKAAAAAIPPPDPNANFNKVNTPLIQFRPALNEATTSEGETLAD